MLQKATSVESLRMLFRSVGRFLFLACCFCLAASLDVSRTAATSEPPGPGFAAELNAPLADIMQALSEVLEDQIVHGTHVFDKEPTLTGAMAVPSTPFFEAWDGPGKVFYKVRPDVVAPRHFKESADLGTIAIRYVVIPVNQDRTRIRIDAIFVERGHRAVHASDGTVESSEYRAIRERVQAIQDAAAEAAESSRRREGAELARQTILRQHEDETTRLAAAQSSVEDLEKRIKGLRQEIERRVKAPGADLKSAPFRSSATVKPLAAYTEVMVVIVTQHWLGVETPDGQRGWLALEQLEPLP